MAGDTGVGFETSVEALLSWNPEYILQIIAVDNNRQYYNQLRNDPIFKDIPAIAEGRTYTFPVGINYWFTGSEAGLGILITAKVLHPDKFQDINVRQEANEFYKNFLGVELDDESYEIMLRGFDDAPSLRDL